MRNFAITGVFVVTILTCFSFMIFKNMGWITWDGYSMMRPSSIDRIKYYDKFKKYIKPPHPYHMVKDVDKKYSQVTQDITVYNILQKDSGFFVEMGAYNGVLFSNTLWLERKHNWTGLLIEANPELCKHIDNVKRVAWRLCACISKETDAIFMKGGTVGGVADTMNDRIAKNIGKNRNIKVPCFTLFDVLSGLGVRQIDYFSLDVEGAELHILTSVKEDLLARRINVKVWTIEYRIFDGSKNLIKESLEKLITIRKFFDEIGGYTEHSQLGSSNKEDGYSLDVVFVKNDIYREYCKRNPDGSKCNSEQTKYYDKFKEYIKSPHPYHMVKGVDKKHSQVTQDVTVYNILQKDGGFFVEMGAYNGVLFSNTLWLERKHNWTGLLIEANPDLCKHIDNVKRVAWRLCACISKETDAIFMKGDTVGGVADTMNDRIAKNIGKNRNIKVPCFTLFEVLSGLGVRQIDYFSLDVEGAELHILTSVKEDLLARRINVDVWTIEYRIFDGSKNLIKESVEKLITIRKFFDEIGGYTEHSQLGSSNKEDGYSLDVVFVKNDIYREYCKRNPEGSKCNSEKLKS